MAKNITILSLKRHDQTIHENKRFNALAFSKNTYFMSNFEMVIESIWF